jgi:hypothetical protein
LVSWNPWVFHIICDVKAHKLQHHSCKLRQSRFDGWKEYLRIVRTPDLSNYEI